MTLPARPAEPLSYADRNLSASERWLDEHGRAFLLLTPDAQRMVLGRLLLAHAWRSGVRRVIRRMVVDVIREAIHLVSRLPVQDER